MTQLTGSNRHKLYKKRNREKYNNYRDLYIDLSLTIIYILIMDKKIIGLFWLLFGGVLFLYKCCQAAKYTDSKKTINLLWGLSVGCLFGLLVDMALLVMSYK